MNRLVLLRHAKSDWSDGGIDDHARPLNARGREAAARIGRYLKATGIAPALVVCSTARRTVETLTIALAEAGLAPEIVYDRAIYLAPPDRMLDVALAHACKADTPEPDCVMVVGHNPGTESLAAALAQRGDADLIAKLKAKYPTGGLAVFSCGGGPAGISAMKEKGATLDAYVVPRELA